MAHKEIRPGTKPATPPPKIRKVRDKLPRQRSAGEVLVL